MDLLIRKRNVAFERLKMEHVSAKHLVEREPAAFEVHDRLRKLAEMQEHFDRIQTEIEEAVPVGELLSTLNVRLDYERLFYTTKGIVMQLLQQPEKLTVVTPGSQAEASSSANESGVQSRQQPAGPIDTQLPTYSLPIFNGDRTQWASFKDLFVSSVDSKNLTNALKPQLLMSHLEGQARSLASNFSITDANYKQVWDTLMEHFDKPKFAVAALFQEFCEQPVLKVMNLTSLRKLVSTSDEVARQLQALGPSCETRDPWLIYILLKKMDDSLRSQWAQHIVDNDDLKFDELLKFLKRKCEAFETCAAFGGRQVDCQKGPENRKYQAMKREFNTFNIVQQQVCPVCSEDY
ncbi:uncharacterized protein LOC128735796 [Sabethes cyaneus]|uniref:uncharacterized protein LOC128735796 n=1 Tax=Sabethes cyaneus TaxID=53552 RepID=UPI00237E46C9|nr:uncharacterized protein LOC128735796 [Sabethes cyaneus]